MEDYKKLKLLKFLTRNPQAGLEVMLDEHYSNTLDRKIMTVKERKAVVKALANKLQSDCPDAKLPEPPDRGFG